VRRVAPRVGVGCARCIPLLALVAMARPAAAQAPGAYMNVSFVGICRRGLVDRAGRDLAPGGDHDPKVRGFSIPNGERALDGAVESLLSRLHQHRLQARQEGETGVELRRCTSSPRLSPTTCSSRAASSSPSFGRQNPQHPHAWGFADEPLVLNRMFGGEGLRGQGLRLSWLLPTPFYIGRRWSP
jgi:hypothetical protein